MYLVCWNNPHYEWYYKMKQLWAFYSLMPLSELSVNWLEEKTWCLHYVASCEFAAKNSDV